MPTPARPPRRRSRSAPVTPIRVPRSAPGVVVVGGSFYPPHRWHVRVAAAARRRLFGPDGWIVFVPAARSPFKDRSPGAPADARVAMLRLATRRLRNTSVWTDEIDRGGAGPSYMIDTIERLRRIIGPRPALRLLIGADQAVRFHEWRRAAALARMAPPAIVLRPPITTSAALRRRIPIAPWLSRIGDIASLVVPAPVDRMSSTDIRAALMRRRRCRDLDPAVLAYIRRCGLYTARR